MFLVAVESFDDGAMKGVLEFLFILEMALGD